MHVPCPHCGRRNVDEFVFGGDISHLRPSAPQELSDASWCEYIYTVPNVKGVAEEIWWHKRGCNRWFVIQRDSRNDEVTPVLGKDKSV